MKSRPALTTAALLFLLTLGGCAASDEEDTDDATGAATASSEITSLTGSWVDYSITANPLFGETMFVPVGITKTSKGLLDSGEGYALYAPTRGAYTLTVENRHDNSIIDGARSQFKLPRNVIDDAIGRIAILAVENGHPVKVLTGPAPQNLSVFEKLHIEGDRARFDTTTITGEHLTGTIELPGLTSGKKQYAITASPRNRRSGGSILGAYLFALKATCDRAGCIRTMLDDDDAPPRR